MDGAPGSPRYAINRVIHDITRRPDGRALLATKAAFLAGYQLGEAERLALTGPDWRRLLELGALPNLVYRYYILHGNPPETFPAALAVQQR